MAAQKPQKKPFLVPELPPGVDLETVPILKKAVLAHRYLAELKGDCHSNPNQTILINTDI
jgi:hypothetical protein